MAGFGRQRAIAFFGLTVAFIVGIAPRDVQAQSFGIGPRMVVVSGSDSPIQDPADTSKTKFTGGFMRIRAGKHTGVELSMDYRVTTDATNLIRVRNTPIQGSFLFYPFKTAIAPYVLGGVGWYRQRIEALSDGKPVISNDSSKFGYHTGVGGELMFGKHASIFMDYRYTFVNVNGLGGLLGTAYSAMSLTSLTGLLSNLNNASNSSSNASTPGVTHLGSMWTTGMTLYF